jgi:hypothetical protein
MRSTINLPDALGEAAKARAARQRRTFTSLIEEGLRRVLDDDEPSVEPRVPPAYGDPGAEPLVELRDREQVWAALDADGPR